MKKIPYSLPLSFFLGASFLFPTATQAAVLQVLPGSSTVTVGSTITLNIMVNTEGVAINTARGVVTFPRELFDVVSVGKSTSLFTIWAQAPAYDGDRSVSFVGGLPTPGYQGSSGQLFSITLRAKAAGNASVSLINGRVYANDGNGTDVFRASSSATVVIAPIAAVATPTKPVVPPKTTTPTKPTTTKPAVKDDEDDVVIFANTVSITSVTHPSENVWYKEPAVEVAWVNPQDTDMIETLVSTIRGETPTVRYKPAISNKSIESLEDGIWYFNIRAHSTEGWGPTVAYQLKIDSTPPTLTEVAISFDSASQSLIFSAPTLQNIATDALSGLSKYVVLVDNAVVASIVPSEIQNEMLSDTYSLPIAVSEGDHTVIVRAVDQAGNYTDSPATSFTMTLPPTLVEKVIGTLQALSTTSILLIFTLILTFLSITMNFVLWRRLYRHERAEKKAAQKTERVEKVEVEKKRRTVKVR